MVALALAMTGCASPTAPSPSLEADPGVALPAAADSLVELADGDAVELGVQLDVDVQVLDAGADIELSWRLLATTDAGEPVDLVPDPVRVELLQFADMEPDAVLQALADGSLSQRDVTISVRCVTENDYCSFSQFVFQAGHAIDVPGAFEEGSGTWLAQVYLEAEQPPTARLILHPRADAGVSTAHFTDDCSSVVIDPPDDPGEPLAVPADGRVVLDWSDLETTSFGQDLSLPQLDQLVLARVRSEVGLDDAALRLLDLAEDAWVIDISGRASVDLRELQHADRPGEHFIDFAQEPTDRWLVGLHATTDTVTQLQVLVELGPD